MIHMNCLGGCSYYVVSLALLAASIGSPGDLTNMWDKKSHNNIPRLSKNCKTKQIKGNREIIRNRTRQNINKRWVEHVG